MPYSDALARVSKFYNSREKPSTASESFRRGMKPHLSIKVIHPLTKPQGKLMAEAIDFPKRVMIALAHAIKHLSAFGVADAFAESKFFTKFATRAHMLLAANTIINLEIFRNKDEHTEKGSLIWVLDRTKTKFGSRLLRSWVARPLIDKR